MGPTDSADLALLDTLFAEAPVGLGFWDTELRCVRLNAALAAINGVSVEGHLGRRIEEVLPEVGPQIARLCRRVLQTGEPVLDQAISGPVSRGSDEVRHRLASYYPVRDADGELLGVGAVVRDVTDHKRADAAVARVHARVEFLAAASRLLESSLDLEETLEQVARLVVPHLADWAFVELVREDGRLERVVTAAVDPEQERRVRELGQERVLDVAGSGQVSRTGAPQLLPVVPDELLERLAPDPERLRLLRELGFRSCIVVPLRARGVTLGALTLVMADSGRQYGPEDLALAEELADRCAMAVANARLYAERSFVARTLQQAMLPATLPDIPALEVAVQYRAAAGGVEVGGDFYDVYEGPQGWQFLVGDVVGKGATAAAGTGLVRHTVRALSRYEDSPSDVLRAANATLLAQLPDEEFCTIALVQLTPGEGGARARVACAGHPLPLLVRADGAVEAVGAPAQPVGVVADPAIVDVDVELRPGDSLLLYTDGVTEARGEPGLFGERLLRALLATSAGLPPAALADRVLRAVEAFQAEQRDDIAIVALRVAP